MSVMHTYLQATFAVAARTREKKTGVMEPFAPYSPPTDTSATDEHARALTSGDGDAFSRAQSGCTDDS